MSYTWGSSSTGSGTLLVPGQIGGVDAQVGTPGDSNTLQLPVPDGTNAFYISTYQVDNASGAEDQVCGWTWNGGAGGAPVRAGEAVWGFGLESDFLQSGQRYCELNLNYLGTNGTSSRRPIAVSVNRSTHEAALGFAGVTDFYDSADSPVNVLRINEDGQIVLFDVSSNAAFIRAGNEQPALKGQKTAGSGGAYLEIARVDASNRISFDAGVAAVSMLLNSPIVQIGKVATGGNTTVWIDNGATPKVGFFTVAAAGAPVAQQTRGATLTNNVTAGGTDDTITNWTNLSTYSTDAAAIRNAVYQLARAVRMHDVALRALGLET